MNVYTLNNGLIEIKVKERGAELTSLSLFEPQLEFLWQADAAYWPRHAPVLFPFVGKLKDERYFYNGENYNLPQHGFARDMTFSGIDKSAEQLSFLVGDDADTLERFPFHFELQVDYRLDGNSVHIAYTVRNPGAESMLFSIGGHPGFRCPLLADESFGDYYLEFGQKEHASRWLLKDGLFSGETEKVLENENVIPLSYGLFENDAIVFKGLKSDVVSLLSRKHKNGLSFHFPDCPYLGIWTKKNAPFICIEPWWGLADSANSSQQLMDKEGIRRLEPGKEFRCSYSITPFSE